MHIFVHGLECGVLAYLLYHQWTSRVLVATLAPKAAVPEPVVEQAHFEYPAGAGAMCVLVEKDGTESSVRVFAHVTEPPLEIRRPHGLYVRGEQIDGRWIYHRAGL